jgi:hypothetical protein
MVTPNCACGRQKHDRFDRACGACELAQDAVLDAQGVYRWKTNNSVPPEDILNNAGLDAPTLARCKAARSTDLDQFMAKYRKAQAGRQPSAEERFEMRAAFGPGVEVVNVIVQVGDLVKIKGVRSHIDGRQRVAGTVVQIDRHSVVVQCGVRTIHARPSRLVLVKKAVR